MKNKTIGLLVCLALLTGIGMTAIKAGDGVNFRVEVQVNTDISIPTLCENANSTFPGSLEFKPGITAFGQPAAKAVDSCQTSSLGDWNVTMAGNVELNLDFALNETSTTGVSIGLGNDSAFGGSWSTDLSTTPIQPTWAQDKADGSTLQVWQQVAANTSAQGHAIEAYKVLVTSSDSTI